MRFTRDDEAYEFLLDEILDEIELAAVCDGHHRDMTIESIADRAGVVLVGTSLDEAHRRWAKGAAMV